ncbi:YpdA family putative bacillithiol disulfide reductase [Staphylospora marina]|uniref:YpdA family putative bacillithiol disulfide reductase n=1 Tax=Staphylospora marina TaxID=2490858 RepID=UPI000F5BDF97|nr:YpdA family putative bacillithiol disulfide reductase [Staphylospora marina]
MLDVVVIGAGPCGIAAAIEMKQQGLNVLIIEKGCLVNSIYHYPLAMKFFSSADNLEIGGIPFITVHDKPTRAEALAYYRTVVRIHELKVHTYEKVTDLRRHESGFLIFTESKHGIRQYEAKHVILATGYYDQPHMMGVPGEELPHVHHYFRDAHPYADQKVAVIGGRNSAIDAALECYQVGADVTMIYRKAEFHESVKAWVRPVIENAIKHGRIRMHWESEVEEIKPGKVVIRKRGQVMEVPADVVFAMTGYRPDLTLLRKAGAVLDEKTGTPVLTSHMETTVPGLYLAGVVATGADATKIFIENGRYHGQLIARDIVEKQRV